MLLTEFDSNKTNLLVKSRDEEKEGRVEQAMGKRFCISTLNTIV